MKDKEILIVYKGHHCRLKGHIVENADNAVVYANENEVPPWLAFDLERQRLCAFCDGVANLQYSPVDIVYKDVKVVAENWFYKCQKCNAEFETEECMKESLKQFQ